MLPRVEEEVPREVVACVLRFAVDRVECLRRVVAFDEIHFVDVSMIGTVAREGVRMNVGLKTFEEIGREVLLEDVSVTLDSSGIDGAIKLESLGTSLLQRAGIRALAIIDRKSRGGLHFFFESVNNIPRNCRTPKTS